MLASFPWMSTDLNPFSLPMTTPETFLPVPDPILQTLALNTTDQILDTTDRALAALSSTDFWETPLLDPLETFPSPPSSEEHRSGPAVDVLHPEFDTGIASQDGFPPRGTMVELFKIFFERNHFYFPLFHRQSMMELVDTGELAQNCPLLLFAIMALAAKFHPEPSVRVLQASFYEKSRALYEATTHLPEQPLQTLQAAACITHYAFSVGDHSDAALTIGKAWRQTVSLGFHHLDTPSRLVLPGVTAPDTDKWREKEQRRRALWVMFIMDRSMCFKAGLVHTIDDRQISVFLPMHEDFFQNSETPPDMQNAVLYPHNSKAFINTLKTIVRSNTRCMMQFIILAHSLMGRISEHMFSPVFGQDDPQHLDEREQLEQNLAEMRLMLPRYATDLPAAYREDFRHVIWLRMTMDVNTISLHHRPQPGHQSGAHVGSSVTDSSTATVQEDRWQHCVVAAQSTVSLIREASAITTDLLMNPFLVASIFTSARILVIEYVLSAPTGDALDADLPRCQRTALRDQLEVMVLIFERLSEAFGGVMDKFRVGLLHQLNSDAASIRAVKAGGTRGLLESCGKWPKARDVQGLEGILD